MKKNFSNKLVGQIGENLVVAELGRRCVIATTFSGNVPDIDVLAYKDGVSIPIQVKTVKKGNLSVDAKDYLEIEFEGDKQIVKGKNRDIDRGIIFVIVYIGKNLGDEEFYICTKGNIQDLIFKNHSKYLAKNKGVRPKNPKSTHCSYNKGDLVKYINNWKLLT